MTRWIAETPFDCVDPKGKRFRAVARVGEPELVPRDGKLAAYARCPISFKPFTAERKIGGHDTFHALCLAIHVFRTVLKGFVRSGGKVLFPGTKSHIDLDDPSFLPMLDIAELGPWRTRRAKRKRPDEGSSQLRRVSAFERSPNPRLQGTAAAASTARRGSCRACV